MATLIYFFLATNIAFAAGPRTLENEPIKDIPVSIEDSKDDPSRVIICLSKCCALIEKKYLRNNENAVLDLLLDKCLGTKIRRHK